MAAAERGATRIPTVIAEGVHVTYRVQGIVSGQRSGIPGNSAVASLRRILRRGPAPGVQYIKAVRGVTFTAYKGDAIGLIGRNGSGKSTLLQALAGLLPLAAGQVFTCAEPALLGVNAALIPALTGERNIQLGSLAMGLTPTETAQRRDGIVEFAGIGDFVSLPMNTYSSGMGARLRFAIATSVTHDILLVDEALATGDAEFQRRSEARIRELRASAGTVFIVSHGPQILRDTCNRGIWLEQGKIVMDGDMNEVLDAYEANVNDQLDRESRGGSMRASGAAAI
jgi:teichoic acid transport system ATP-binding protein